MKTTRGIWPPHELAARLGAWARGYYPTEAAVGILVRGAGGMWLRRSDFINACVELADEDDTPAMAAVAWGSVTAFLDAGVRASSGEVGVLRAAVSIAGIAEWSLREVVDSLDADNLGVVLDAIAHQAGWHEDHRSRTVTGFGAWPAFTEPAPKPAPTPARRSSTSAHGLPSFEEIRREAYAVLGDAGDWLRSDWRPGTGPSAKAAAAIGDALTAIAQAKAALSRAAGHDQIGANR